MTAEPPKRLRIMRNTITQTHAQLTIMAPTRKDSAQRAQDAHNAISAKHMAPRAPRSAQKALANLDTPLTNLS